MRTIDGYTILRITDLLTLDQANAVPHATPKGELETKLDRAIANKTARLADERELRAWARAVKERDHWRDRRAPHPRLRRCLELDPLRAEAHHVVSKDDWAVRYDVRNGICLSLATHILVERNVLAIEGTAWFTVAGTRYIDARYPVTFVRL